MRIAVLSVAFGLACLACGAEASQPAGGNSGGTGGAGGSGGAAPSCDPVSDPAGFPAITGPGGPSKSYPLAPASSPCAFLDGGPWEEGGREDPDHHNGLLMLDGYLVMPWAPEWADGGISIFDFSDACTPVHVATADAYAMRETHAAGLSLQGGRWMAVTGLTGLQFWDMADVTAPTKVSDIALPGVFYPDSYARVVLSMFWQAPYVYVAGADNGLYIVDAGDPKNPELVTQYSFEQPIRAGGVFALGNLLAVTAAEGSRTVLLDIADPADPKPIPGGTFEVRDEEGTPREIYHSMLSGDLLLYARKEGGGGLVIYDISDPTNPTFLGLNAPEGSNGGYVYVKEDRAFVGNSSFANIFDISDPSNPVDTLTINLIDVLDVQGSPGDLDTLIPIGNVVVAASDDSKDGELDGRGSQMFPYQAEPDALGPQVTAVNPRDGASDVPLTARVGVGFGEFVELGSVWKGSVQLREVGCEAPLPGAYSGQEGIVSFWPTEELKPGTTYEVMVPAGGVLDYSGNPTSEGFRSTFTTAMK